MTTLGEFLKSINKSKENVMNDDPQAIKDYQPYIINKCLSYFPDTLILVNELNILSELPKDMQYNFLLHAIKPRSRFSRWHKKKALDDVDIIKKYYQYSDRKAEQVLNLFDKKQIEIMKEELETGS